MAGHGDATHLFAYLEAEMPGEELTHLEARYASDQLWCFEQGRTSTQNTRALHRDVLRHFQVEHLTVVTEEELEAWLFRAFQSGRYSIHPVEIWSDDEKLIRCQVAFRVRHQ